jgi:hypothetical protein
VGAIPIDTIPIAESYPSWVMGATCMGVTLCIAALSRWRNLVVESVDLVSRCKVGVVHNEFMQSVAPVRERLLTLTGAIIGSEGSPQIRPSLAHSVAADVSTLQRYWWVSQIDRR